MSKTLPSNNMVEEENSEKHLFKFARSGIAAHLSEALRRGVDLECRDEVCRTALLDAVYVQKQNSQTVVLLIEAGADLGAKDRYGRTALILAAIFGKGETLSVLAKAGADLEAAGFYGVNALMFAAQNGHDACVKLLIEAGADVGAKDCGGMTAREHAAMRGQGHCVDLMDAHAERLALLAQTPEAGKQGDRLRV